MDTPWHERRRELATALDRLFEAAKKISDAVAKDPLSGRSAVTVSRDDLFVTVASEEGRSVSLKADEVSGAVVVSPPITCPDGTVVERIMKAEYAAGGMGVTLYISRETRIPVGDFLRGVMSYLLPTSADRPK
jgi:hypothetical protein